MTSRSGLLLPLSVVDPVLAAAQQRMWQLAARVDALAASVAGSAGSVAGAADLDWRGDGASAFRRSVLGTAGSVATVSRRLDDLAAALHSAAGAVGGPR